MRKEQCYIWIALIIQCGVADRLFNLNNDGSLEGKSFLMRPRRDLQMMDQEKYEPYARVKRAGVSNRLTEAQRNEALDVQNLFRFQVANMQNASNMNFLTWNSDLADQAQEWANNCDFEHSTYGDLTGYGYDYPHYGENLYFRGPLNSNDSHPFYTITHALTRFFDEEPNYDYESGKCIKGICGHYTQLVWGDSRELGCAWSYCPNLQETKSRPADFKGLGRATFFVCMYHPAGNYQGQKPYKKGPAFCADCQTGQYTCYKGLCRNCTRDGIEDQCVCKAGFACSTAQCSGINTDCTCDCKTSYHGKKCETPCEDKSDCSGYTTDYCTVPAYKESMEALCPALCSVCQPEVDDDACQNYTLPILPPAFPFYDWELEMDSTTQTGIGGENATSMTMFATVTHDSAGTSESHDTSTSIPDTSSAAPSTMQPDHIMSTALSGLPTSSQPMTTKDAARKTQVTTPLEGTHTMTTISLEMTTPNKSFVSTTIVSTTTTVQQDGSCRHWTCFNGGEVRMWDNVCKCKCSSQWQGEHCQEYTKHQPHGIKVNLVPMAQSYSVNGEFEFPLFDLIPSYLTNKCNQDVYFERCCRHVGGLQKKPPQISTFVTRKDLHITSLTPPKEGSSTIILIYVIIPKTSALCNNGNVNTIKKRSLQQAYFKRHKREVNQTSEEYLSQDVLYEVVLSFKSNLSEALQDCCNMTIHSIEKGLVEEPFNFEDPDRFPSWAIIVTVFIILFIAAITGVIVAKHQQKKKKTRDTPSDEHNGNASNGPTTQCEAETVQ